MMMAAETCHFLNVLPTKLLYVSSSDTARFSRRPDDEDKNTMIPLECSSLFALTTSIHSIKATSSENSEVVHLKIIRHFTSREIINRHCMSNQDIMTFILSLTKKCKETETDWNALALLYFMLSDSNSQSLFMQCLSELDCHVYGIELQATRNKQCTFPATEERLICSVPMQLTINVGNLPEEVKHMKIDLLKCFFYNENLICHEQTVSMSQFSNAVFNEEKGKVKCKYTLEFIWQYHYVPHMEECLTYIEGLLTMKTYSCFRNPELLNWEMTLDDPIKSKQSHKMMSQLITLLSLPWPEKYHCEACRNSNSHLAFCLSCVKREARIKAWKVFFHEKINAWLCSKHKQFITY